MINLEKLRREIDGHLPRESEKISLSIVAIAERLDKLIEILEKKEVNND